MDRGTYLPLPVSVKTVSSSPESWRAFALGSGRPSCLRPCSRRYLDRQLAAVMLLGGGSLKLPSTVPKLGTGLADMEMKDLFGSETVSFNNISRHEDIMSIKR